MPYCISELFEDRDAKLKANAGRECWTRTWTQIGFPEADTMMVTETLWRCDQVRAGRLYNRMMFDTREEAEQFMNRMRQMEPDQTILIEAVDARQVWN